MSLTSGSRLGLYEILAPIGAGGMGEVYRARDTKLGREVAVKVLPEAVSQDAEKLARFGREAHLLASVNHPNIATLYGLEESNGQQFLVMELVEGETLAERLVRGPMPVEEALPLFQHIAEGLETAHEKGIIHRDLKPSNIKLTPEGVPKILDFGLAKALVEEAAVQDNSQSPTLTRDATGTGVLLGTAAYMSPEQARGKPVDKRTDIFSFGIVLYEVLSGKRAFPGEDVSDVLAGIIKSEPDWTALPSDLDHRLRNLLRRCLVKDRKNRLQAIGDVRVEIQHVLAEPLDASAREPLEVSRAARTRERIAWAIGVLVACIAIWNLRASKPEARPVARLVVPLPENAAFVASGSPRLSLTLSPDGQRIVYVGRAANESTQLYARSLDRLAVDPLEGTKGAFQPFFSPDWTWVGFFTGIGELKKVRLDGGRPVTLVEDVPKSRFAFAGWRDDGTIVFGNASETLFEISAEGGSPVPITSPSDESRAWFPHFDETSDDLLFVSYAHESDYWLNPRIELIASETGERTTILDNALLVDLTASGHLLFVRDEVLMVASYDRVTHSVGPAVPVPESIAQDGRLYPQLAISATGTLAYVSARGTELESTLGWATREGEFTAVGDLPAGERFVSVHLSPDGGAALITARSGAEDKAFSFDLSRRILTRLNVAKGFWTARWHPDGRHIGLGGQSMRLRDLDTGEESVLIDGLYGARSPTWTPDGATVAYMDFGPDPNIYALPREDKEPHAVVATSAAEHSPTISPDGRWVAYVSDESGRGEVYVARFPEGTSRRQITANGGRAPVWSRDGRELFFIEPNPAAKGRLELRAVLISLGETLELSTTKTLFVVEDQAASENLISGCYDVSPDGTRFLMIRQPADPPATEIVVVQNWFEELKRLVPTE